MPVVPGEKTLGATCIIAGIYDCLYICLFEKIGENSHVYNAITMNLCAYYTRASFLYMAKLSLRQCEKMLHMKRPMKEEKRRYV